MPQDVAGAHSLARAELPIATTTSAARRPVLRSCPAMQACFANAGTYFGSPRALVSAWREVARTAALGVGREHNDDQASDARWPRDRRHAVSTAASWDLTARC